MKIRRTARTHERPARPRGGWRKGLVALAALLPVVSVLAVTSPASAHANVVTGVATCQADGTYTVTWTIANDFNKSVAVTLVQNTGGGSLTGLPATIAASPSQPYKTITATQTGVPGTTKSASLKVHGVWADNYAQDDSKSIVLDGKCAPQHQPVTLCHATDSNTNPYVKITVDDDSTVKDGHGTHTGPIWNGTVKPWGDIIPAFDYYNDKGVLSHYPGLNNTSAGLSILADDCTLQVDTPAKPVPTPPTCSANGSLTLTNGAHYTWADDRASNYVGTHHVIATADKGWKFTNGKTTVSYDVVVEGVTNDCKVTLVAPTVTQPICTGPGTSSSGSIDLPASTSDVTYSLNGTVVTATTHVPNKFTATTGWVIAGNGLSATYTVTLTPAGDCLVEVVPVVPDVVQAKCTGPGTHSDPVITPAETTGITYSVNGAVVTATPQQGYTLGTASGWTAGPNGTQTFTANLTDPGACLVDVTPVAPSVVQATCTGPGTSDPAVITPATTAHITYSVNGNVVTATPDAGYQLAPASGWTAGPNGTATYTVTLTPPGDCLVDVTPVDPTVVQSVCSGPGTATVPTVTPATTKGITYTVNVNVVTATPDAGYTLKVSAPWVLNGETGVATYTATFTDPGSCLVVVAPVAPSVEQATCTGPGTSTQPVITPATTEHITYTVNGNVVTATPDKGYELGAAEGWTIDPETGVGTFTVTLLTPDCTVQVTVVDPTITTSEQCGVDSTFTIPATPGVTYLVDGEPIEPGTYSTPTTGTITAQAQQGYALSNSEWSFALDLPATTACPTVVTPIDPTVDPSTTCGVEGTYTIPSTEGIEYLLDGVVVEAGSHDGPASGTITARALEGFSLADAQWSFGLDLPAAETPCELPNTGGKLPQTGAQTGWVVGGGAAALLAGLLLVLVGRRREDAIG